MSTRTNTVETASNGSNVTTPEAAEHVDVLIVGAGISGIAAAHYIQANCPWASYAVVEARESMGGTWDLFRYPGVRSDSDMYTLGYSFRPWDGEKTIADGGDILRYLKATAVAEGIDEKIRFRHRVVKAEWSTTDAVWTVTLERSEGDAVTLTCSFLMSCTGYYRYDHGHQPDFAGRDDYQGTFIHPQHWPEDLDYTDKKVVIIGSGATAVTLLPAMTDKAAHVTMLQRTPGYVASLPLRNPLARVLRAILPDRVSSPIIRTSLTTFTQGSYFLSKARPDLVRKVLRKRVEAMLPKGYDVDTHFNPTYNPWDQRLCAVPDGDMFKAIRAGKASVVTDHIDTFTETGIRLRSGNELQADVVVSATGLDLLFMGGMELVVDGEPVVPGERLVYKGMMLEGVPNVGVAVGYTNASWTMKAELTCQHVTRLLNHMRDRGLRQCTPRNQGGEQEQRPLLGLDSGYVERASAYLPKQGSREPWLVHQNYWRDLKLIKRGAIDQDLEFSNPRRPDGGSGTKLDSETRSNETQSNETRSNENKELVAK